MTEAIPTEGGEVKPTLPLYFGCVRADWALCFLLAVLGFVVRLPALSGEPVWDDDYLVRTNPFIKSPLFVLEVFRHYLFQDTFSAHYRPVQNLSYMADYLLWNNNFYGFHLSSLLLHVGGGILLYLLVRKLIATLLQTESSLAPDSSVIQSPFACSLVAFLVALLWVVHPVHSAAVDYVSGRADSLAFLLGCGGWLLFLKGRELKSRHLRRAMWGLAWLSGLLALCSRENGSVWIAIFLIHLFAFERPMKLAQKWVVTFFCLAMLAGYCGLRTLPGPDSIPKTPPETTPALRAVLMLRSLGDYGRLMIFPTKLHMERTVYDPKSFQSDQGRRNAIEHEYLSLLGLVVLSTFIALSMRRSAGQRLRIFGAFWFFAAYLPISNLIELNATVAEHWLYLPSVGFLLFLAGCAVDLPMTWRRVSIACACVAVVGLSVRTIERSSDWISNEVFARRTIQSGGATLRVVLLLGQAYATRGDYVAAERLLRRALELSPGYPTARNNLADALVHEGKSKEAEALFVNATEAAHESRKEYPRTWIAALNLSQLRHKAHDDAGAIALLEKARQDYPGTWELIGAESELLRETDKVEMSLALIRPFAQDNWWHYRAWGALGRLLAQQGDVQGAMNALRHASWLDIHETAALNLMALIGMHENQLEDACRTQRRAVARQPNEPRQYLLLSNILDRMGRTDEAQAALAQVSRLRSLTDPKTASN